MEFAMLGVHLYFQALTEKGPELLEPGVEKAMRSLSGRGKRETVSLGLIGQTVARTEGFFMPNQRERK